MRISHIHIASFEVDIDDTPENCVQLKACYGEASRVQTIGLEYGRLLKALKGLEVVSKPEPRKPVDWEQ